MARKLSGDSWLASLELHKRLRIGVEHTKSTSRDRATMGKTVAVDFDGVIHVYSKGWHDGTIYDGLMPGATSGLLHLMQDYAVFIFTTRDCLQVAQWTQNMTGIPITILGRNDPDYPFWNVRTSILVTNLKYAAIGYIDDRAYKFSDWDQATLDW